jgi:hypothetical protein
MAVDLDERTTPFVSTTCAGTRKGTLVEDLVRSFFNSA